MGRPCPRCGDRYTQSLPMVYGTGTSVRNWTSVSGRSGSSVSQSIVSSLAAPPLKRSVIRPILWLLLVCSIFGPALNWQLEKLSTAGQAHNPAPIVERSRSQHRREGLASQQPAHPQEQSNEGVWILAVLAIAVCAFLGWQIVRAVRFNYFIHPHQLENWKLSFMCKGCGEIF